MLGTDGKRDGRELHASRLLVAIDSSTLGTDGGVAPRELACSCGGRN
jgi:hypothetical protein